jgi:hypothetical protein
MKRWWIAVFVAGVSFTAPVFAHDDDDRTAWSAGRALRSGTPDRDYEGWDGTRDGRRGHRKGRREQARHAEIRHYYVARARAKHELYHRARARAYAEEARESAARARAHATQARRW